MRRRVYLTDWEWDCCGEPFSVGDEVDWTVTRAGSWVREILGAPLADTVELVETHHGPEAEGVELLGVVGVVVAIQDVVVIYDARRVPNDQWRPDLEAAAIKAVPASGWSSYIPVPRYFTRAEIVPGSGTATPAVRVPSAEPSTGPVKPDEELGPTSWRYRGQIGYLVDLEVDGRV